MTSAASPHLQTVIDHWPHLRDMLTTHHGAPWPPAGRMRDYLAALEALDSEQVRADRELEVPSGQPPLRIAVHDTMRTIEAALVELADQVAADIQRVAIRIRPAGPGDGIGHQLAAATLSLALADAADPCRWRWTGARPTAPDACRWLLARLHGEPGPFRPLSLEQRHRIARIAAEGAQRIERALDLTRRAAPIDHPCPHCHGQLEIHGGDGRPPAVTCATCGRTWTGSDTDTTAA